MGLKDQKLTPSFIMLCIEFAFLWLIILPLVIYQSIRYYKLRNEPEISKRYTNLVLAMSIFCIVYTTLGRTISLSGRVKEYIIDSSFHFKIDTFLYIVGAFTMLNILLWRVYLLNFKIRYAMMIEKGAWMKHINAKSTQQSNWYYKNKNTFGNVKWMYRIFVPALLFQLLILFLTSRVVNIFPVEEAFYGALILEMLILLIIISIFYHKTPLFMDTFRLRDEIRYILYVGLFGFCSFVIVAVIDVVGLISDKEINKVIVLLNEIIIDAVFFTMVMISTYWVLKHSVHNSLIRQYTKMLFSESISERRKIALNIFLSKSEGVYSFMAHLCHEFSPENLLFVYEANQFKQFCGKELIEIDDECDESDLVKVVSVSHSRSNEKQKHSGDMMRKMTAKTKDKSSILLPDDLPKSDIVYCELSIQQKFKLLADKYILQSAELQVNLPYLVRDVIYAKYKVVNSLSNEELYNVFDDAVDVVNLLMGDSYSRFSFTKQYNAALSDMSL